jgi:hypothetical protein
LAPSQDLEELAWILKTYKYYRKFVKNYGKFIAPLTSLLKKMPLFGVRPLNMPSQL